jgi:hypothetical protein
MVVQLVTMVTRCMCVYACMYVYIYVFYLRMYLGAYVCMYACMYVPDVSASTWRKEHRACHSIHVRVARNMLCLLAHI